MKNKRFRTFSPLPLLQRLQLSRLLPLSRILPLLAVIFAALSAAGCAAPSASSGSGESEDFIRTTSFQLNTVVVLTIYDSDDESLLSECMELCSQYENIFSRTSTESELYKLNHRELSPVEGTENTYLVSEELAELISLGLDYSEKSNGAFDIAVAPLTELWDFTAESPEIPNAEDIQAAVPKCGLEGVSVNGREITLVSPDTAFDLGGIAKGYIADRMKEFLISKGVKSATINLGGNVLCIGNKPDGTPFKIGVQKPFADRNETAAAMEITDQSVVSSGIYERFFEQDGQLYHHILNPVTGYPYENDLIAVTIISDRSVDGDALSTTCFALGYEEGMRYAESLPDIQAIFITDDYQLHYTKGFEEKIALTETGE